ncbi:hypothetical protein E2C01_025025 [Portunus trituberculatus]|uniref:Uncharacterized protein n=1 Tax=Portunus trituberculatus TaxID=210409 RepID=A0A5B7EDZ6_PORTR|nr:hypothetical protein [Portunus trituberculatus]
MYFTCGGRQRGGAWSGGQGMAGRRWTQHVHSDLDTTALSPLPYFQNTLNQTETNQASQLPLSSGSPKPGCHINSLLMLIYMSTRYGMACGWIMKSSYSVPVSRIEEIHQTLLREVFDVLVDPAAFSDDVTLKTVLEQHKKIHLHSNT